MKKFENKILYFLSALQDIYRDSEERESIDLPKLELVESELTEDFTAMFYAMFLLYQRITGDKVDALGFTHICNRLVFQHIVDALAQDESKQEGE